MNTSTLTALKFQFVLWLLVAFSVPMQAQNILWENTLVGSGLDNMTAVRQTLYGQYIVGGTSNSTASYDKTAASAYDDIWLLKLNTSGNSIWQRTIGGSAFDKLNSLEVTSDNGYILAAHSNSNISGQKSANSFGHNDFWILKLNEYGIKQWDTTIGGNTFDSPAAVIQATDGGYFVGGTSNSIASGNKTENSNGGNDYYVVKLDANGNILWQNSIGGSGDDELKTITQTADGGYLIGGHSSSNISGDKTEGSQGGYDYWVVKLSATGQVQWDKTYGGTGADFLHQLVATTDGGFLFGGYSTSNATGHKTENAIGGFDFWLLKTDANGNIQWQNTIGGTNSECLLSMEQATNGDYVIGGYSDSNASGDKTENSKGGSDFWILGVDNTGSVTWQKTIGGSDSDHIYSIDETTDNGFVLGGYTRSPASGDKAENGAGQTDYWVVKIGKPGKSAFHFEDQSGATQTTFYCQDVFMDGSASQNETDYYIDVWSRPAGSTAPFGWKEKLPWKHGQVGTLNLSDEFATKGFYFVPGYEYQIKLALSNNPHFSWVETTHTFTVATTVFNASFNIYPMLGINGNILVDAISDPNSPTVYHWWDIFYAPNGSTSGSSQVPGEAIQCCSSDAAHYGNLQPNTWYYIKHGVWDDCTGWMEARQAFIVRQRSSEMRTAKNESDFLVEFQPMEILTNTVKPEMNLETTTFNDNKTNTATETLHVFPNPTQAGKTVTLTAPTAIKEVQLFDIAGKSIGTHIRNLGQTEVHLQLDQQLVSGIYIVRLKTETGVILVEKLVVK